MHQHFDLIVMERNLTENTSVLQYSYMRSMPTQYREDWRLFRLLTKSWYSVMWFEWVKCFFRDKIGITNYKVSNPFPVSHQFCTYRARFHRERRSYDMIRSDLTKSYLIVSKLDCASGARWLVNIKLGLLQNFHLIVVKCYCCCAGWDFLPGRMVV